jgi:hypothetical protein
VDARRLDGLARLVAAVEPEAWSEHLAFVRGGGLEIGHLAALPRHVLTVDGLARNCARARRITGATPLLENVATLIRPPGSDKDEISWILAGLEATGADLLLDLHNLHANAVNFGFDARAALARLPAAPIRQVPIAGGRWIARGDAWRLLDDHRHAVPDPVYDLLEDVGRLAPGPTTKARRDATPSMGDRRPPARRPRASRT